MEKEFETALFFDDHVIEEKYYRILEEKLMQWEDVHIKVSKTQISFISKYLFACVSLPVRKLKEIPPHSIIVTFGLEFMLDSKRIWQKSEPYPNRWTHHVIVSKEEDIDEELMMWLYEAYYFNRHKTRRK